MTTDASIPFQGKSRGTEWSSVHGPYSPWGRRVGHDLATSPPPQS